MVSTYTTNKRLEKPANGDDVDTWDVPVNANSDDIDTALGGTRTLTVTGQSGVVALAVADYRPLFWNVAGVLTANVNYQLPSGVGGQWVVYNGATGAFTLTFSSAGGGTSYVVPAGVRTILFSDGTNVALSINTAAGIAPSVPNYLTGFTVSYPSTSVFGVAAGSASDSTNTTTIATTAAFTKSTGSAWAAGSGNGAMGTALTIAADTTYPIFAITNAGETDYYLDVSLDAVNAPAGTTAFRRIGFAMTNSLAQLIAVVQIGDQFLLSSPALSVDTSVLSTTPIYAQMAVPTGVTVVAQANGEVSNASTSTIVLVHSPLLPDQAAYVPEGNGQFSTLIATNAAGSISVPTDTSGRLRVVAFAANTVFKLVTTGWIDTRGKD